MQIKQVSVAFMSFICAATSVMAQAQMQLSSSSIVDGKILKQHACGSHGGKDESVQLSISNLPAEAKFVSIVMDDPDAQPVAGKTWVHWNVFNMPVTDRLDIPANSTPAAEIGRASGGTKGYEGMCPPNGTHTYRFAVFATKEKVKADGFFGPTATTIESFESKYGSAIVSKAQISGKF